MKLKKIIAAVLCLALTGCMSTQREISSPEFPSVAQESTGGTETASDTAEEPTDESPRTTTEQTDTTAPTEQEQPPETAEQAEPQDTAQRILAGMTVEEKVGQLVLTRYPGTEEAAEALEKYRFGGFTLFAADFEDKTPAEITAEIAALQESSAIPLLFAVDEEGGSVVRISKYPQYRSEKFPSQAEVLSESGTDGVYADAVEKSELLKSLGLNMNLAPVCDLPRSEDDYIYDRAFGTDLDAVVSAVVSAVKGYLDSGLICTLKHFPGYGNNLDTHTGISVDSRPMSELTELDLQPFVAGINAGAAVVMVSHNIVECVNSELPGSLSGEMYALVRSLGFDGVILTDDLSMDAVKEYSSESDAAVQAFSAGADLLCSTDYESAVTALLAAVNSGEITEERLDESVLRILEMKAEYGVLSE